MKIIVGKIDVTKISKARLFPGKNGAKYLDFVMMENDEPDRFGNDFMIVEGVSKEERAQGVRGVILGNGKYPQGRKVERPPSRPPSTRAETVAGVEFPADDSVPF